MRFIDLFLFLLKYLVSAQPESHLKFCQLTVGTDRKDSNSPLHFLHKRCQMIITGSRIQS